MPDFPQRINVKKELNSFFLYLITNGFSREEASLFLSDEIPTDNFVRLFVWPIEANEGKKLIIDFYKEHLFEEIDLETTTIRLNGRYLCLTFNNQL